ncbi:MAG: XdhC family protein [Thermoplasmataceae archaeon]|jgi:xanthine dehydrogenase accessory factor
MENYDFAGKLGEMGKKSSAFVVATVIRTEGSSLAKPGFKVIIQNGSIAYGTLGGACPENVILDAADSVLKSGQPRVVRVHLEDAGMGLNAMVTKKQDDDIYVETFCGGTLEIYLEPYLPSQKLYIIGQGGRDEIEDYLVMLGKNLNFKVTVIDHAPSLEYKPDNLVKDMDFDLSSLDISSSDFIVVLTKGERDITTLKALSEKKPAYIGLLASRKRIKHDFEVLKSDGVSEKFLASIHTPIGIDINAVSPFEIALSIASEIVRERHSIKVEHELRN